MTRRDEPDTSAPRFEVSVVIPAFNRGHLIGRAIESVRGQSARLRVEVVVVDDASDDDTVEVAARYGAKVIRHETNQGVSAARNTGVEHATGEWIAFLDSDDEWLPRHLETLWPRRSGHVLVAASAVAVGADGVRTLYGHESSRVRVLGGPAELLFPENPIPTSGVIALRNAVREVGGFSPIKLAEDLDLWVRMAEVGSLVVCPEPGYVYHHHASQATADREVMRRDSEAIMRSFSDRSWFSAGLGHDIGAVFAWDAARAALGERRYVAGASLMVRLVRRPRNMVAVARLLRSRRARRRRQAALI